VVAMKNGQPVPEYEYVVTRTERSNNGLQGDAPQAARA